MLLFLAILNVDDGIKQIKEHAEQQGPDFWVPSDLQR